MEVSGILVRLLFGTILATAGVLRLVDPLHTTKGVILPREYQRRLGLRLAMRSVGAAHLITGCAQLFAGWPVMLGIIVVFGAIATGIGLANLTSHGGCGCGLGGLDVTTRFGLLSRNALFAAILLAATVLAPSTVEGVADHPEIALVLALGPAALVGALIARGVLVRARRRAMSEELQLEVVAPITTASRRMPSLPDRTAPARRFVNPRNLGKAGRP